MGYIMDMLELFGNVWWWNFILVVWDVVIFDEFWKSEVEFIINVFYNIIISSMIWCFEFFEYEDRIYLSVGVCFINLLKKEEVKEWLFWLFIRGYKVFE